MKAERAIGIGFKGGLFRWPYNHHPAREHIQERDKMTRPTDILKNSSMLNRAKKGIVGALVAASLGLGAMAGPAQAAGSLSITLLPGTAEDAQAMRAGMMIFNILNSMKTNGGVVRQNGFDNSAGLRQYGSSNFGTIWQEGVGHQGTLQQNGTNNAYGIYQFGENTNVDVSQFGSGQTGATFIFGF